MAYSLGSGKNIKTDSSGRITSVDVGGKQTGFNEAQKQAFQAAVAGGDPRGGGFRYRESPFDRPGSYQDAAQNFGITPETPYGTARPSSMVGGFFNKLANATGGQVNYNLTPRQIQRIMERSYSRAINPYNIVGQPGYYSDAGGDLSKGIGRVGLKQGEMTREGIAQAYRAPISGADRAAIGLSSLFIPGASFAADQGTRVMGLGDRVPEGATPLRGGILDAITGGQTDFLQSQGIRLLDKVSSKADQIINTNPSIERGNREKINGGITNNPTTKFTETADASNFLNNPALMNTIQNYLRGDRGLKIGGQTDRGNQYQFNVDPLGRDKRIQFNMQMPLQDFGLGSLIG